MIAHNDSHSGPRPAHVARLDALAHTQRKNRLAECAPLRQKLLKAEAVLERDADAASLLLDGVLAAMFDLASHPVAPPPMQGGDALHALQSSDPLLAIRLRLALRAPDVRARIVHARACLDWIERLLLAGGHCCDAESS